MHLPLYFIMSKRYYISIMFTSIILYRVVHFSSKFFQIIYFTLLQKIHNFDLLKKSMLKYQYMIIIK